MSTVAEQLEYISRYPVTRRPGTTKVAPITSGDFEAWATHLRTAGPEQLAHIAADAEYLPPSPLATRMRAAVNAERDERRGGES